MHQKPIILYDGVCGLCDYTVQFLIKIDKEDKLQFATLQGSYGIETLKKNPELGAMGEGVVFVSNFGQASERASAKSEAIFKALAEIGGWWKLTSLLRVIPVQLRDLVYDFIAHNRYKWFGKYDQCKIPSPEIKARFLD